MVNGKEVKHKRASKYLPSILAFEDEQWESINQTAAQWVEKKKKTRSSRSSSMDVDVAEFESDEEENFVLTADVRRKSPSLSVIHDPQLIPWFPSPASDARE